MNRTDLWWVCSALHCASATKAKIDYIISILVTALIDLNM